MRERMLAVVQRHDHDRVPFCQYSGLAAPDDEIWSVLGRANVGILRWSNAHRIEHPNCRFEEEDIECGGLRGTRTRLHTPEGSLTQEKLFDPVLGSASTRSHFVKEPADYVAFASYLRDVKVLPDEERLARDIRELGDDGLPHVSVDRTPYQQLWVRWAGLENLSYHMVDCPGAVEECVSLIEAVLRQEFEIAAASPAPYVVFPDNITAPVIGERLFRRYCVPLYDELAGLLEGAGKPVYVHMDGDLKPLWDAIAESRVGGLDSLSPAPDNDTRVGDAAAMWPEMRLGVNFPSSVHLRSGQEVYEQARLILEEAGHTGRLQIQISENVPPDSWRKSYPRIARAIEDFGSPA